MNANREVFGDYLSTEGAFLRSPVRDDTGKYPITSVFCFVIDKSQGHTPRGIVDRFGQVMILNHVLDLKVFHGDKAVGINYASGKLVSKVFSLVMNFKVMLGQKFTRFASVLAALFSTRHLSLGYSKFRFFYSEISRVIYDLSVRCHSEVFQSDINANLFIRDWQRFNLYCVRENCIPLIAFPFESDGINFAFEGTMQPDFEKADIQNVEPIILNSDTIAISGECNRIKAVTTLESGISSFFTTFNPTKESFESLIQSAEYILTGTIVKLRYFWDFLAKFFKLIGLVIVVKANALHLVSLFTFLKAGVVKFTCYIQHPGQFVRLNLIWVETINKSLSQLFTLLSFDVFLDCLFTHVTDSANVVTARPETGQLGSKFFKFQAHDAGRISLKLVNDVLDWFYWIAANEKMHVVRLNLHCLNLHAKLPGLIRKYFFKSCSHFVDKDFASIFRAPNKVIFNIEDAT